jgi:uncharacterized protein (DUF433 family)
MKQWQTLDAVERDAGRVGGVWVFRGTRVPVSALFENLRDGATVDEFLEWFPGVLRVQPMNRGGQHYPTANCCAPLRTPASTSWLPPTKTCAISRTWRRAGSPFLSYGRPLGHGFDSTSISFARRST